MWTGRGRPLSQVPVIASGCDCREGFLGGPSSPLVPDRPWAQGKRLWFGGEHVPPVQELAPSGARLPLSRRDLGK